MIEDAHKYDLIDRAIAANREPGAALAEPSSIAEAIRASPSQTVQTPFERPSNALQTREEILAAHRRAHRRGTRSKIEADPELAAVITARIATLTFAQVVEAVKSHFPPDRHISLSGLHRWFRKRETARITIAKYQA